MMSAMTSIETARAVADPFGDVGGRFMLSGRTYQRGAELGFSGIDFYFCGRAGVLGDVDAQVVTAEFGFFAPEQVRVAWESGGAVMRRDRAVDEFMACGYEWGRARLPGDLDGSRLAELVRTVVDATGDDRPRLFSAWRDRPWPVDERDAALHAVHLMRELRGGAHVAAVRDAGLDPHAAVVVRGGEGPAEFFGWSAPHPDPEQHRAAWVAAEAATDAAVADALEVLDEAQQGELVRLARACVPG